MHWVIGKLHNREVTFVIVLRQENIIRIPYDTQDNTLVLYGNYPELSRSYSVGRPGDTYGIAQASDFFAYLESDHARGMCNICLPGMPHEPMTNRSGVRNERVLVVKRRLAGKHPTYRFVPALLVSDDNVQRQRHA